MAEAIFKMLETFFLLLQGAVGFFDSNRFEANTVSRLQLGCPWYVCRDDGGDLRVTAGDKLRQDDNRFPATRDLNGPWNQALRDDRLLNIGPPLYLRAFQANSHPVALGGNPIRRGTESRESGISEMLILRPGNESEKGLFLVNGNPFPREANSYFVKGWSRIRGKKNISPL